MSTITSLKTIRIKERPNVIWVEIKTDEGLTGLGESFRGAAAIETIIHEQFSTMLLGKDSRQIEKLSSTLCSQYLGFESSSAEMRAASAIDIALWDLHGQRCQIPVYEALGGASRSSIPVYNTCAGYSFNTTNHIRREITSQDVLQGPYDDQLAFTRDAGVLAESLVSEGYKAMKIWPFDPFAAHGGHTISLPDLKKGLAPFEKIRRAVGDDIEVMCELHSLWGTHAAERICRALEDYHIFWVEDPINKMDDINALRDLRRRVNVQICGSETLGGTRAFRDLLSADAVDVVMVDLSWCGGLTVGRKISTLAESYHRPIAPHDCTGPVVLMAGIHLALHASTAIYQEVVRANLSTWYLELVDVLPTIQDGCIIAPTLPGLGMKLKSSVYQRSDAIVRDTHQQ